MLSLSREQLFDYMMGWRKNPDYSVTYAQWLDLLESSKEPDVFESYHMNANLGQHILHLDYLLNKDRSKNHKIPSHYYYYYAYLVAKSLASAKKRNHILSKKTRVYEIELENIRNELYSIGQRKMRDIMNGNGENIPFEELDKQTDILTNRIEEVDAIIEKGFSLTKAEENQIHRVESIDFDELVYELSLRTDGQQNSINWKKALSKPNFFFSQSSSTLYFKGIKKTIGSIIEYLIDNAIPNEDGCYNEFVKYNKPYILQHYKSKRSNSYVCDFPTQIRNSCELRSFQEFKAAMAASVASQCETVRSPIADDCANKHKKIAKVLWDVDYSQQGKSVSNISKYSGIGKSSINKYINTYFPSIKTARALAIPKYRNRKKSGSVLDEVISRTSHIERKFYFIGKIIEKDDTYSVVCEKLSNHYDDTSLGSCRTIRVIFNSSNPIGRRTSVIGLSKSKDKYRVEDNNDGGVKKETRPGARNVRHVLGIRGVEHLVVPSLSNARSIKHIVAAALVLGVKLNKHGMKIASRLLNVDYNSISKHMRFINGDDVNGTLVSEVGKAIAKFKDEYQWKYAQDAIWLECRMRRNLRRNDIPKCLFDRYAMDVPMIYHKIVAAEDKYDRIKAIEVDANDKEKAQAQLLYQYRLKIRKLAEARINANADSIRLEQKRYIDELEIVRNMRLNKFGQEEPEPEPEPEPEEEMVFSKEPLEMVFSKEPLEMVFSNNSDKTDKTEEGCLTKEFLDARDKAISKKLAEEKKAEEKSQDEKKKAEEKKVKVKSLAEKWQEEVEKYWCVPEYA